MKKVMIIGCPGGGNSTFARKLQEVTGLPLYYLDMMYWNPDKTVVEKAVFRRRLQEVIEHDEWIIDGNYGSTLELRMRACDTVFFLDYPVEVCLAGIESRKGKFRPDMPWIETSENSNNEEFISFIKNYNSDSRPKVLELLQKYSDRNIVVFHSREESELYLNNLK